jgi:phosphoribosylaminoimidazolecarboxamide formyltransferase/IMP cyclohydrolase
VIVAPAFEDDALEVLTAKKNVRVLTVAAPAGPVIARCAPVSGGLLAAAARPRGRRR